MRNSSFLQSRELWLRSEYPLVQTEEGVFWAGLNGLQPIAGWHPSVLLSQLLPLMDGTKTDEQICSGMRDIDPNHIKSAISQLGQLGLLRNSTQNEQPVPIDEDSTNRYLRMCLLSQQFNETVRSVRDRLAVARVLIVCRTTELDWALLLQDLLLESPANRVQTKSYEDLHHLRCIDDEDDFPSLVVALNSISQESRNCIIVDEWCRSQDIPWLRATLSDHRLERDIGPLFGRGSRGCFRCFSSVHLDKESRASIDPFHQSDLDKLTWVSLLGLEITRIIGRFNHTITARSCLRFEGPGWKRKVLDVPRVPGCSICFGQDKESELRSVNYLETSLLFEEYVGRENAPSGVYANSRWMELLAHPDIERRLTNSPHFILPFLDSGTVRSEAASELHSHRRAINLEDLSLLLQKVAGFKDRKSLKRWTATAGNLGSVEIFVALTGVEGMQNGLYFYEAVEHSLGRVQRKSGQMDVAEFISQISCMNVGASPQMLFLFVGKYNRLARKYGPFGYRLINLDAGVAVSQLEFLAQNHAIHYLNYQYWPDELIAAQTNISPFREQVTAVVALSRTVRIERLEQDKGEPDVNGEVVPSRKIAREFCGLDVADITKMLYLESRREEPSPHCRGKCIGSQSVLADCGGNVTKLPESSEPAFELQGILHRRKSVRAFSDEAVNLIQLGKILKCAYDGDQSDWPSEHESENLLRFLVLASNVCGIGRQLHWYDPIRHALVPAKNTDLNLSDLESLYLQKEFAVAPLAVWVIGDLYSACTMLGSFGHRQLLLRAGASANRLWMCGLSVGLEGTITAGLIGSSSREHLGVDCFRALPIIAVALGVDCTTD